MDCLEQYEQFRGEVRRFCRVRMPADIHEKVLGNLNIERDDHARWQAILASNGWLTGHWPVAHGGLGWPPLQRWVFEQELYDYGSPGIVPFGVNYAGPVIYTFGSEEQRRLFLPGIRSDETWWAQGYSEAGAGSDLASVRTKAVRDGDDWVVSGTKLWTTMAHWGQLMFALVRTSPGDRPQQGLSFIVIDLASPGVSIRPIITIDEAHHVNEVVLDDVRIPAVNLIGEEGQGWAYTKFLLQNERLLGADVGRLSRKSRDLVRLLSEVSRDGQPLISDQSWKRRVAGVESRLMALESLAVAMFEKHESGADANGEASALKIFGSELAQEIEGASIDALSHAGLSFQTDALAHGWPGGVAGPQGAAGLVREYLFGRVATIYGGSTEIQKNIIAKSMLEL